MDETAPVPTVWDTMTSIFTGGLTQGTAQVVDHVLNPPVATAAAAHPVVAATATGGLSHSMLLGIAVVLGLIFVAMRRAK